MKDYNIKIEPEVSHISERIHFTIENLPPDTLVKINAVSNNYYCINSDIRYIPDNSLWTSSGEFYTDKNGTLDLSKTAPSSGSYKDADEMGLIYSMTTVRVKNKSLPQSIKDVPQNRSYTINFTFTIGSDIFTESIKRYYCTDDVLCKDVDSKMLKGRFFVKNDTIKHPAVIVLSGSDGRIEKAQSIAQCLSMEGFAALAVCYFGMDGVSPSLEKIPLEIVENAIRYLKAESSVDKNKIGIYGRSKGGEMALEAASIFSDIRFIAVTSPSCITYAGLTEKSLNSKFSSWSYKGKELPCKHFKFIDTLPMIIKMICGRRNALCSLYQKTLDDFDNNMIHLEKINGPILFISSDEDEVWPSRKYGQIASSYLQNYNFQHDFIQKNYQYAGHMMTLPYQCIGTRKQISSSPSDFIYGSINSWKDTVNFFKKCASE